MSQGPEWAADANVYVTGHKDGTIRVWKLVTPDESPDASTPLPQNTSNTDTGLTANSAIFRLELHKRLDKQHQGAVTALAFSTNLKRLYSGDSNGNVVRWEELPPTPGASRNPGPQSEKPSN
jgi:WD40 repeat protein